MFDYDTHPTLERGTVHRDEMTVQPQNNFTNLLVLRELESHAVFTTDGQSADLADVAVSADGQRETYLPGLMFMRKQTGSDRRFAKALQRDYLDDVECSMKVNDMCQECPECILYGSAASSEADQSLSITSRVMYDTAYTLRDASAVIDEKFQNAPGDEYAKEAQPTIREPDFFEPGTLFPSVVTLRDATLEEVAFVLAITKKNKRYGATTSRLGRVKNHILGIYAGSEEGPANLELTREVLRRVQAASGDDLRDVVAKPAFDPGVVSDYLVEAFDEQVSSGLDLERVPDDTVSDLIGATTGDGLAEVLETQRTASKAFIKGATDG
jgi:CRISPR-associated protein Csc2